MVRSPVGAYGVALAALVAAVLLRWLVDPWLGDHLPLATLYAAVALAVWAGGSRPAALVAVLGYLACAWMFVVPRGKIGFSEHHNLMGLVAYLFSCAVIVFLGRTARAARSRADASRLGAERELERRRQAEESLRNRTEEIERLLDVLPAAVWVAHDPECRSITSNQYAERQGLPLGTDVPPPRPTEAGRGVRAVRDGREMTVEELPLQRTVASGTGVENVDFDLELPGGRTVNLLCNTVPLRDASGRVRGAVAACLDVSTLRAVERQARESDATLRAFYEHSPLCMSVTEPTGDGDVLHLYDNPAACRFFGVEPPMTSNRRARADLGADPAVVERWLDRYKASEAAGGAVHFEHEYRTPEGLPHWLSATVCPIGVGPSGRTRFCYVAEDVTERKLAEEALRAADRRKDEFLATLAHELRNPLAPIRNAVQLLKARGTPDPEQAWSREVIDRQVAHMARLLDDLLDVNRITRNRLELRKSRITLASVVESALETSRPLIDAGGHELAVTLPADPVHLDADPVRLAQVFSNLLNNAAKYTHDGGRIALTAERAAGGPGPGEVVVSVTDSGMGIAPDALPQVFEMFSQADPALERSRSGLGIGLSLARGLVEMHGGRIEARSDGPGKGSAFVVHLPVVTEPLAAGPATRVDENGDGAARYCILVVDDLDDNAESLALVLRLMGHEVRTAHDGHAAVAAAEEFRPDVVLLDLGMPRMNGYEACRHIREQPWGKGMFLVAVTGWGQEDDRHRTEEAGFDRHMVKPVDPADLIKVLASASRSRSCAGSSASSGPATT